MSSVKRPPHVDLEVQRIDLLYRQNITGLIAAAINSFVFCWVAWPYTAHAFLLVWAAIVNGSVITRVIATLKWNHVKRSLTTMREVARWHYLMVGFLLISGVGWGSIGFASINSPSVAQQITAAALIVGMSAGALASYAASLPAMYAVLVPATVPWAIIQLLSKNPDRIPIGFLLVLFCILMMKIGRNLNSYVRTSLDLNVRLRESEENLRQARDSSDAISWQWQIDTDQFSCEGNVERLLGPYVTLESSKLADFFECIYVEDREALRGQFLEVAKGRVLDAEVRLTWPKENPRWIAIRGKTADDPEKVDGICWDITVKKSEESLRHERDLFAAENRAKLVFLANVSHEIRTPLAAITGFATAALESLPKPSDLKDDLSIILRNGKFLIAMVNDLLDFSRSETDPLYIQKSVIHPVREIEDALLVFQPVATQKGLRIDVIFDSLIPETIESDPIRFRQILTNVLANAVKYTERGSITIHVSCEMRSGGGNFRVVVEDTGIGMSVQTQRTLFQPFVRGDALEVRRQMGSGLGLALAQSLSRRLGGDIKLVASAPGQGSIFEMVVETGPLESVQFLPGSALREIPQEKMDDAVSRQILRGKKLLLVEDDPDLRALMERILVKQGATIEIAENGQEAIEHASRSTYHAILMDMKMPVMDGYRATSVLRSRGYRNSIIAVTAGAGSMDKQMCFRAGCDAYLSKPVDLNHLIDVIGAQEGAS